MVEQNQVRRTNRSIASWLVAFSTSLVGDQVFYVALTWAAVQVTDPSTVGLILVGNAVARAVVLLVGGVLADRLGPKWPAVVSDGARTLIMVAMAVSLAVTTPGVLPLVVLAVLFGIVDGFYLPAIWSLPVLLAPPGMMTRIQALKVIVTRAAMFAGAPLGSWLILTGSVPIAFAATAVLFAVAAVALVTITIPPANGDDRDTGHASAGVVAELRREVREGLALIARHDRLRTMVILVAILDLGFAGPITVGVPLLANENGWGVAGVGWILGGFGLGATASAGYLALRPSLARPGRVGLAGLVMVSVCIAGLGALAIVDHGLPGSVIIAGALGLVAGLGSGLFGTVANSALATLAPEGQVGRVMALVVLAGDVMMPISLAATGWITEAGGAALPFVLGGGLMLCGAAYAFSQRAIREL